METGKQNNAKTKVVTKNRAIIYSRVSTVDQTSTKEQSEDLKQECIKNNEEIIEIIEEKKTAKDKDKVYNPEEYIKLRPKFYDVFLRAKRKEFDILRIWKWDRFARSDFQPILIRMFNDYGIKVLSLRDSNEPLVRDIQGVIAKSEINKIKERVELKQQGLKKEHNFLNRPPTGYYVEKQILKDGRKISIGDRFLIDEKKSKIIRKIFKLKLEKVSNYELAKKFKLSNPTISNILSNPTYIGYNIFRGEVYLGKHEPIISLKQFKKLNPDFKLPKEEK